MLSLNVYVDVPTRHVSNVLLVIAVGSTVANPSDLRFCMKFMWTFQHCQHFCCYKGCLR
jgi:hypothetical protein